jgi:hypothetical protein
MKNKLTRIEFCEIIRSGDSKAILEMCKKHGKERTYFRCFELNPCDGHKVSVYFKKDWNVDFVVEDFKTGDTLRSTMTFLGRD